MPWFYVVIFFFFFWKALKVQSVRIVQNQSTNWKGDYNVYTAPRTKNSRLCVQDKMFSYIIENGGQFVGHLCESTSY